jgi:hypothetical protein
MNRTTFFTSCWRAYKGYIRGVMLANGDDNVKDMLYWRNELFYNILTYIAPLSIIALVPGVYMAFSFGAPVVGFTDLIVFALMIIILLNRRLSINQRKSVFISLLYCLSVILLLYLSMPGPGLLFLLALTVIISLIYSYSAAYYAAWANTVICILLGVLIYFKVDTPVPLGYSTGKWIAVSSNLVLLGFVSIKCLGMMLAGVEKYINDKKSAEANFTHTCPKYSAIKLFDLIQACQSRFFQKNL